MITETAFHFAYYELSESWPLEWSQQFVFEVNRIRAACRSIGIQNRDITELKLSHYILILDSIKSEGYNETLHPCSEVMNECLEFLITVGMIYHNPVKSWLTTENAKNLYETKSTTQGTI